ncbi:YjdF family protein [Clostridium sp. DJ247]|uniref:YjdF family protein n=1 Tax=Clostridium sp. DJ247 TaxID=2726188 RepID=UPI00162427CA|nr:YjdF family protein [Clostridium sp. DJ247]MBC2580746.1 YjdF family protein [Clostridium sp. DJ247]
MNTSIKLTVFFEGAFWVGVFEKTYEEKYEVSKVIFGSEPKDYDVFNFIIRSFYTLRFSNSLSLSEIPEVKEKKISPKRLQKEIKKETENKGIGTKAQLAMKLQYETNKVERKKISKEKKEEEKERKFELRQQKKLMKHKGH